MLRNTLAVRSLSPDDSLMTYLITVLGCNPLRLRSGNGRPYLELQLQGRAMPGTAAVGCRGPCHAPTNTWLYALHPLIVMLLSVSYGGIYIRFTKNCILCYKSAAPISAF